MGATGGFLAHLDQVQYDPLLLMLWSTRFVDRACARGAQKLAPICDWVCHCVAAAVVATCVWLSLVGQSQAAPPAQESLSERRAVRGSAVDDRVESPELNELRQFEEQSFPRAGGAGGLNAGVSANGGDDSVIDAYDQTTIPPPELPGRWEGTGDVPQVLRTPDATLDANRRRAGMLGRQPESAPDSEWLRALKLPELPVRWDPAVLRYLDYFRSNPRGHAIMGNWLKRAGRFRSLIEATMAKEGLPKDLLYVAMVESGFETGARSRVGAGGIWQFMPGAGRAYGLEVGYWVDARRDPERSVEAAARYLKDLYVRFGSWHLVFAAYNAGYGAVLQSITRYNTNDYWELCRHEAGLPWESSLYVPKILAAAIVGHNTEAFGFADVVPDPPFSFERVEVPAGTTLATVARATKASPEAIAALNPQIARDRTPPDRGAYSLRIPPGSRTSFDEAFERNRSSSDRLETVTLRFGETLESVAKTRGISVRELRRLNAVKDSAELRAGVAIVVPRRRGTESERVPSAALDTTNATKARNVGGANASADNNDDDDEILVAVPDRVFNYEGRERVFYRTRDADTLDEVSEAFGVGIDDLIEWNHLDSTAKLHPKMVLQIFVRKDFDPRAVVLIDSARVRVVTLGSQDFLELETARRGKKRLVVEARASDTLAKIGRRYGLTVGDLARINRFSHTTELHSGQKIVVYSPAGEPIREVASGMRINTDGPRRERGGAVLTRSVSVGGPVAREGGEGAPGERPSRPVARMPSRAEPSSNRSGGGVKGVDGVSSSATSSVGKERRKGAEAVARGTGVSGGSRSKTGESTGERVTDKSRAAVASKSASKDKGGSKVPPPSEVRSRSDKANGKGVSRKAP